MRPRSWLTGGLVWLAGVAIALQLIADLFAPLIPTLIVVAVVALVGRRLWRGY